MCLSDSLPTLLLAESVFICDHPSLHTLLRYIVLRQSNGEAELICVASGTSHGPGLAFKVFRVLYLQHLSHVPLFLQEEETGRFQLLV